MVEGGAAVISSFLLSGLVDFLVVTVAPVMVGDQGVGYGAVVNEEVRVTQTRYIAINSWRDTTENEIGICVFYIACWSGFGDSMEIS